MTFTEWLRLQEKRDDPVGDLARDIRLDSCWPTPQEEREEGKRMNKQFYRDHLSLWHNACQEAIEAIDRAWKEFQAELGPVQ